MRLIALLALFDSFCFVFLWAASVATVSAIVMVIRQENWAADADARRQTPRTRESELSIKLNIARGLPVDAKAAAQQAKEPFCPK